MSFCKTVRALAALFLSLALAVPALAQQRKPEVPGPYMKLLDLYRDWKPEYVDRQGQDFAGSIFNWALRVYDVEKNILVGGARNWAFTRSEAQFAALADAYAGEIQSVFGEFFAARGLHGVFSTEYSPQAHAAYQAWYDCMAQAKWEPDSKELVGENNVLSHINWDTTRIVGSTGECKEQFVALSRMYGIQELSADEITAIGFLSRRQAAHLNNKHFLSAEVIRKAVKKVFDPE